MTGTTTSTRPLALLRTGAPRGKCSFGRLERQTSERVEAVCEWMDDGSRVPEAQSLAASALGLASHSACSCPAPSCRYRSKTCRLFRDPGGADSQTQHRPPVTRRARIALHCCAPPSPRSLLAGTRRRRFVAAADPLLLHPDPRVLLPPARSPQEPEEPAFA